MGQFLFANNAGSSLAGAITNVATTCNLAAGTGALFPNPSGGNFFAMTLVDAATGLDREIVYVTSRSGDTINTMLRGQEGTAAQAWAAGDLAQNLMTANTATAFLQNIGNLLIPLGLPIISTTAGSNPYTPTSQMTFVEIDIQSAGGAGTGCAATGAGAFSLGGTGGAGARLVVRLTRAQVVAALSAGSLPISLGAAGAGGSGIAGTAGAASTIGTAGAVASIPGGTGGGAPIPGSTSTDIPAGALGGAQTAQATVTVGTALFNMAGAAGGNVALLAAGTPLSPFQEAAGVSFYGQGAPANVSAAVNGANATTFGAGGGGTVLGPSGSALTGGNGGGPRMIIQEYLGSAV